MLKGVWPDWFTPDGVVLVLKMMSIVAVALDILFAAAAPPGTFIARLVIGTLLIGFIAHDLCPTTIKRGK